MTIGSSDNSSSKINGVIARDVITYSDNRGSFAEIIKASEIIKSELEFDEYI